MIGTVSRFPVEDRMPTRVAEEKLGGIVTFQYPSIRAVILNEEVWLEEFLLQRSVLMGWDAVKRGIVKSFKGGRVRHLISRVRPTKKGRHPSVDLFCSLDVRMIFNWKAGSETIKAPVVLLSSDQTQYFKLCERCAARVERVLKNA